MLWVLGRPRAVVLGAPSLGDLAGAPVVPAHALGVGMQGRTGYKSLTGPKGLVPVA